jgi:hypothetical protein
MKRIMMLLLVLALAVPAAANAADRPHPTLNAVSTEVAGKPVRVHCETSEVQWIGWQLQFGRVLSGFTFFDQPVTYIAPNFCHTLHWSLTYGYREVGLVWLTGAVSVLVHEAVHQRGIRDERVTECTAQPLIVPMMQKYFGLTATVPHTSYQTITEPKQISRTVRRKIAGKWRRIRIVTTVMVERVIAVQQQVPNPDVARAQQWVTGWHEALPPEYTGC